MASMRWGFAVVAASFVASLSVVASADPRGGLHVTHEAGAADCPDAPELARSIERVLARPLDERQRVDVSFGRDPGGYRAVLSSGGVRVLRDVGPGCSAIAAAAIAAVAMILDGIPEPDPPAEPASSPEVVPAASPRVVPPSEPAREEPLPREPTSPRLRVSAGPAGIAGMVSSVAPGGYAELAWRPSRFLLVPISISGFADRVTVGPGAVDVTLALGATGLCFAPATRSLSYALCAGAAGGVLHGSGDALTTSKTARHSVFGLTAGAELHGPIAGPVSWILRAHAFVPSTRDGFSVENRGVVARMGAAALVGGAGLAMTIP